MKINIPAVPQTRAQAIRLSKRIASINISKTMHELNINGTTMKDIAVMYNMSASGVKDRLERYRKHNKLST